MLKMPRLTRRAQAAARNPEAHGGGGSRVGSCEQRDSLRDNLADAGVTHGTEAVATLTQVEVVPGQEGAHLKFCGSEAVVTTTWTEGDGEPLVAVANVDDLIGIELPAGMERGFVDIENVSVSSNGRLIVKATPETAVREHIPA